MKREILTHAAVVLICAFLLFPMYMSAQSQGGLQTDTNGSVTGTAGTKYLWVNAANFPDDGFRFYLQQNHASTATNGGKYVIPANVTDINLNTVCCSYTVGNNVGAGSSTIISQSDVPQQYQAALNDFLNNTGRKRLLEEAEEYGFGPGSDYEWFTSIEMREVRTISSIEVVDGKHQIYYTSIIRCVAKLTVHCNQAEAFSTTSVIFSEPPSTGQFPSHNYYRFSDNEVTDLTGINYFTNLRLLTCSNTQLTSLELSNLPSLSTLTCNNNNQLTSLELSNLPSLSTLTCNNNQLTSLNLSNLPNLSQLYCNNNQLTSLDLTSFQIGILDCSYNRLTDLKVHYAPTGGEGNYLTFFLYCNNNFLTNLDNVSVSPFVEGQLVNIYGDYSNNRILAFPLGKHPYYDRNNGIYAVSCLNYYNSFLIGSSVGMTNEQRTMFERIGTVDSSGNITLNLEVNRNFVGGYTYDYDRYIMPDNSDVMYAMSQQNFGVNLSVIDKTRNRIGVIVPDNLTDEAEMFNNTVLLMANEYPEKVKSVENSYYAFNESGSASSDLDYCHAPASVSYRLFNGYATWITDEEYLLGHTNTPRISGSYYNLSQLNITQYADWFDPNVNKYYSDPAVYHLYGESIYLYGSDLWQHTDQYDHKVTLNADHYVMYVNPISEDTQGKCNGTAVFDYDAIIPEGLEAYIVTGYTDGGEADRFKTGKLEMVKVGDGDGAGGYKRVIPAGNPVCLRTKQTVSEGQAADKMSTTGLYPFLNNNERTNYPCPDPNDAQYEPLDMIPASLFEGNKLRGVLNTNGQSYTAGTVLTLGRYMDNGEKRIGFWTYKGAKLNMHRVYILKSDLNMPSDAKGCTMDFGDSAVTTAIGGIDNNAKANDNNWYTLQGIRLHGQPTQNGVYIYNGKKVVVRNGELTAPSVVSNASSSDYTDNF